MCFSRISIVFYLLISCDLSLASTTSCDFGAFVNETDKNGLNVRSEPSSKSKIVGNLPSVSSEGVRIEVQVMAGQSGWFQIKNAQDNASLSEKPRKAYKGVGWVSGRQLTIKSQSRLGYEKPDENSKKIYVIGADEPSFDTDEKMASIKLIDCQNKWARVEHKGQKFWLNEICAIQETTCSGF